MTGRSSFGTGGPFRIIGFTDGSNVAGNGTVTFDVKFVAPEVGSFSGVVKVYHSESGSPANIPVSAQASSGLGLYFNETESRVMDNRMNVYSEHVGLKYAGGTPLQGLQFRITAPSTFVRAMSSRNQPSPAPVKRLRPEM